MENLRRGQLYKANNDVYAKRGSEKNSRELVVKKGEIVEFRYNYPVHFRTTDNLYLNVEREVFDKNFSHFGDIYNDIRQANKHELSVILEHKLYKEVRVDKEFLL